MTTVYKRTGRVGGTTTDLDYIDGADLSDGDLAFVVDSSNVFDVYELDDDSAAAESSPAIVSPDSNAGDKRWIQKRQASDSSVPDGTVVPWIPGYFGDGSNGSFTTAYDDSDEATRFAAVNTYLNTDGWYLCDGASCNVAGSTFFDGAGRYLPNITDDIFIVGQHYAGQTGGTSSSAHTHPTGSHTLDISEMPSHNHDLTLYTSAVGGATIRPEGYIKSTISYANTAVIQDTGGGGAHNHGSTSAATSSDNRPKFLSCFYIIKVN